MCDILPMRSFHPQHKGFTLVSTVVAVAIFVLMAVSVFTGIMALVRSTRDYRESVILSGLANQYLEFARNIPYSQIGTVSGNPPGSLNDLAHPATTTIDGTTYDIYYAVTYMDDPADGTIVAGTDPAPNDYKQVKLYVKNMKTGSATPFVTNIVPSGLENLASGGALSVKVFNSVGQPVPNASISITNASTSPPINLSRTADASGNWIEVGLPDSVSSYHIVATKAGYSSDQTYPSTGQNPNPVKPDATISNGQVTQVSFAIDQQSSLTYNLVNQTCGPLNGIGLEMRGSKLIGTPNILKFDHSYSSDSNGQIIIPTLEWDNYAPAITTNGYMVYGSSPIQQINVLAGTNQQSMLILGPSTNNSLLVIVKDAATGNAIEGATVELKGTNESYDDSKFTAGSIWDQQDWSSGPGQSMFVDPKKYNQDDGNVDTATLPTGLRIGKIFGDYAPSAWLESSTFDTGASSTYTTITWQPTSQTASTSLKFQIAANNDNATWNYLGPDGTAGTYYTVPQTSMSAALNGNRYIRYKAFLGTVSTTTTPVLSSIDLNYVSGCAAPGQAMFAGVPAGSDYQITVSMTGYTTQVVSSVTINGYNLLQVLL
jgi:type II secretory pathway pseudopilin PulG